MDSTSVFLLAVKCLLVLIPFLILVHYGIANYENWANRCVDEATRHHIEVCTLDLINFDLDYRKWEESNFPSQDQKLIENLKRQCEDVQKCFKSIRGKCEDTKQIVENFPTWLRRIEFFSGHFAKCAGKINQISGRAPCAQQYFRIEFIEKKRREKCEIMRENEECILEKVAKTCALQMAAIMKNHLATEAALIGC
ncbi:unnamed protein product [Caenorhabditis sp. 36 PRJEB53466]|nr:unnamed protein product [Caenorhabditis sp. 36 PRJEB53466]